MADMLFRQWTMLRHIPRQPRRIKTSELTARLLDEGFKTTVRTVERDLDKLSVAFGYTSDTEGHTHYWYWPADFEAIDIPGLEPNTALAFNLAERHLSRLLPPSTLDLLAPYFERARKILDADSQKPLTHWQEKIRIIGTGPRLAAPGIDTDVQRAMYDALLHEHRVHLYYAPRNDDSGAIKEYEFSPLGLVSRDGVIYLVGPLWEYENVVQLALHRVEHVETLPATVFRPPDFQLAEYVHGDDGFNYPTGAGKIRLVILMDATAARHLAERPLSKDQSISSHLENNRVVIAATVLETQALTWWLLGFGDAVEVIEPRSLRERVSNILSRAANRYINAGNANDLGQH